VVPPAHQEVRGLPAPVLPDGWNSLKKVLKRPGKKIIWQGTIVANIVKRGCSKLLNEVRA